MKHFSQQHYQVYYKATQNKTVKIIKILLIHPLIYSSFNIKYLCRSMKTHIELRTIQRKRHFRILLRRPFLKKDLIAIRGQKKTRFRADLHFLNHQVNGLKHWTKVSKKRWFNKSRIDIQLCKRKICSRVSKVFHMETC